MKDVIQIRHGEGLKDTYDLIRNLFLKSFNNSILKELSDAAKWNNFVFTCDAFTVEPIFFPGGDIGRLSIFGTVNDIYVSGAIPKYLSLAIVVEEGFLKKDLEKIVFSIKEAVKIAKVKIITGDFKVVEKGSLNKILITTSGIGEKIKFTQPSFKKIKHKDKIILTGEIAEHGTVVMLARQKILDFKIKSDTNCLNYLTKIWKKFPKIHFMRDPTRGGICAVLNEINQATGFGIRIWEKNIPLKRSVKTACEILGIDPYYLASEGQALIIIEEKMAEEVLKFLKRFNKTASIVGEIDKKLEKVIIETVSGGERILDFSLYFNLPRIC